MRRVEIAKLKWGSVDLDCKYIYVDETKTDENRSIPINQTFLQVLINLDKNKMSEYVFNTQLGVPYTQKSAWNTALKKSEIDYYRFHDLRHTFVSNLIVNHKEDFATVMALSGHKDISMLKRYSHTQEEAKRKAVIKLGKRYQDRDLKDFRIKSVKRISSDL